MLRRYRLLLLGVGFVFLTSSIYAASFGTFPYEIEKQSSDLELEYRIGFINPSSDPVEVTLSSSDSEEYNLTFSEEEFRIPPGTTDDPSGSGWYHLGDGEYTKIHEQSFQVDVSRYREDNSLSFPVTIEAVMVGESSSDEGSQSRLVQIRNYNYRAEIDPNLRPEDRPEQDSGSSWTDRFWQEENSGSEEDFNLEQDKSTNQEQQDNHTRQDNQTRANNSNQISDQESENPLVNTVTLVLVIGIIVSLGYILMEV